MGTVLWLIVLSFEIVGVAMALHAIMNVRSSQGAIAWALTLVLMPFLALPAYWVFGGNRFRGYVRARRARNEKIEHIVERLQSYIEQFISKLDSRFADIEVLEDLCHMHFSRANRVRLLINGQATFDALFEAIDKAQDYLLIQFYIVRDDTLGMQFRDRLVAKARQGVTIYFLYDQIGSYGTMSRRFLRSMTDAGIQIRPFSTTNGRGNRFRLNFRNHRKVFIADGRIAFVGGHNIGDEYLGRYRDYGEWRDTHIEVEGPAVPCIQLAFLEDWFFCVQEVPDLFWEPAEASQTGGDVLVIPTSPADQLETCGLSFVQSIHAAKKRLWISSPYFVPDSTVVSALQLAAIRGVDVRLLVPYRPDNWLVYLASCSFIQSIERMGIKFYRYKPGFLHQKAMIVDDFSMVGTANLDNRSFRLNFEIMIGVVDEAFTTEMVEMFLSDFLNSERITTADLDARPLLFRFAMRAARLLSPIL